MPLSSNKANCILFANDTSLLFKNKDLICLTSDVNIELLKTSPWMKTKNILLYIGKTRSMLFQNTQSQVRNQVDIVLYGNKVKNVEYLNFLAIWIDKNLNWKNNTNEKIHKY